jgi:acetyl-CoA carboxylase carboxyl transferase alpha subunit
MENGKTAWERVKIARGNQRPTSVDYIAHIFDRFLELHGDRLCRDDGAIVGGIATINGIPVTVIGQQKGRNIKQNMKRNFGMPYPEGYRKALRLMKQAEKFNRPIICLVDTPGAFCGIEAEMRGQGEAIARNLYEMSALKVPILSIVIGEGGSGGALALAVANEVWMLENATYSILSPEGFASILWNDSKRADEAAGIMKITATDLYKLEIVDQVIMEQAKDDIENLTDDEILEEMVENSANSSDNDDGKEIEDKENKDKENRDKESKEEIKDSVNLLTAGNMENVAGAMKEGIIDFLRRYRDKGEEIVTERYDRFRKF